VIALEAFGSSRSEGIFWPLYVEIYDEVSQRTPVLNALQLALTEFFQIPADITIAYRPSKTNTTAVQRTCKIDKPTRLVNFVSSATIALPGLRNAMKLFALQ
jgi:hypothetical protein